jgi:hypothetical protein
MNLNLISYCCTTPPINANLLLEGGLVVKRAPTRRSVIHPREKFSNNCLQSLGWEHYEVHEPEPHILLFKSVNCKLLPSSQLLISPSTTPPINANLLLEGGLVVKRAPTRRSQDLYGF